jgi:signal transduction histidine kinase
LALARAPTAVSWEAVRGDPGAVLLLVRHSPMLRATVPGSFVPGALANPAILEDALCCLDSPVSCWVDWNLSSIRAIHQASLHYAETAHQIARRDKCCDPDLAWIGGLLAPLGLFAVAAVDTSAAAACLNDPLHARDSRAAQEKHWGITAAAIGRRLARRRRLPDWLSAIVGHLGLTEETAARFGAEPNLFRTVQAAVAIVENQGNPNCKLQLSDRRLEKSASESAICDLQAENCRATTWQNPGEVPLLKDLLQLSARNLRLQGAPALERLESDFDDLHAALEEHRSAEFERLREQKLRALAEFAAGAGHEINNPLAVISGQAQYLLKQLQIVDFGLHGEQSGSPFDEVVAEQIYNLQAAISDSQKTIIAQAQRIHQILRELMQFARPTRPAKQVVDLNGLVRDSTAANAEFAAERQVRLDCIESATPLLVDVDPVQICTALTCLLRNAIEAAPASPPGQGFARIRVSADHADRVAVVVEDNGSGPAALEREHLFDPFFSGRPAGRGRGLGLPTAWRLANQHGGEIKFSREPDGPTRFTLLLPRFIDPAVALDSSVAA